MNTHLVQDRPGCGDVVFALCPSQLGVVNVLAPEVPGSDV